jgi:hypothetical protein
MVLKFPDAVTVQPVQPAATLAFQVETSVLRFINTLVTRSGNAVYNEFPHLAVLFELVEMSINRGNANRSVIIREIVGDLLHSSMCITERREV